MFNLLMIGAFPILVAEDNEDDSFILQRALKRAGLHNPLHICCDGEELVAYLKAEGPYTDRSKYPFPRILILDLKMPGMGGLGVLRWIRGHPECCAIPAIVLSSSAQPSDIAEAYQLGANAYVAKPGQFDELVRHLKCFHSFWAACEFPPLPPKCS